MAYSFVVDMENLINMLFDKAISFVETDCQNEIWYVDPHEKCEVSAHYGASHMMAALIVYGSAHGDKSKVDMGYTILKRLLRDLEETQRLPGYHFDFNNFAIALVVDYIDDHNLKQKAIDALIKSPDSSHMTVNWLPMRMYVNQKRYALTKLERFKYKSEECQRAILKGVNKDGSIEDRLPYGISFNLQYDISSLAMLQLLNCSDERVNISTSMGFLLECVAPDGDINYQGRGTNQVFAWGPWIYLLVAMHDDEQMKLALSYLTPRLKTMLANDSMMLNQWPGKDRYLWWDYHYASVYIAHTLLWLVLAEINNVRMGAPEMVEMSDSGMRIHRGSDSFVAVFEGRKEYLAEQGPALCALYFKNVPLVKGAFGPWKGAFGNLYTFESVVMNNYCGLYQVDRDNQSLVSRVIHKLHKSKYDSEFTIKPLFRPVTVSLCDEEIAINWHNISGQRAMFNIPLLTEQFNVRLYVDGENIDLFKTGTIKTQYGWASLFQSRPCEGVEWTLRISG